MVGINFAVWCLGMARNTDIFFFAMMCLLWVACRWLVWYPCSSSACQYCPSVWKPIRTWECLSSATWRSGSALVLFVTNLREVWSCMITEKASTGAFSWLKVLPVLSHLRHYAYSRPSLMIIVPASRNFMSTYYSVLIVSEMWKR